MGKELYKEKTTQGRNYIRKKLYGGGTNYYKSAKVIMWLYKMKKG